MVACRWLTAAIALASISPQLAHSQPSAAAAEAELDDDDSGTNGPDSELDDDGGTSEQAPAGGDPKQRESSLAKQLTAAIAARPALAKAKIAVAVFDLAAGRMLFSRGADQGMNVASNTKLLTAAAALGLLGGGFRWRTSVHVDDLNEATGIVKGNLYVRGRGDPSLSAADLDALARDVAARGVRRVLGDFVVDNTYFDNETEPPRYDEQTRESAAFRAPVATFAVARSAVTITVQGEPGRPGKPATIRLEPNASGYVRLGRNAVRTVTSGRTRIAVRTTTKGDHMEIDVTGSIRVSSGRFSARRRVDDPTRFAAEVFRNALAERGVKISRSGFRTGPVPPLARLVARRHSAPLTSIIRNMNKYSDNHAAECVLKTLGAELRASPGPATWADGTTAVSQYLASIGIPPGSYRAENGSGLFGASAVSTRQIVAILRAAYRDFRVWTELTASLPVGGVDGTLARRWRARPAKGRVRAKTGTLAKVIALAGYVGVDSGRPLAFAIAINDIPGGQRSASRAMSDDMVDAMIGYLQ